MSFYVCYLISTLFVESDTYYGTKNDQFTY